MSWGQISHHRAVSQQMQVSTHRGTEAQKSKQDSKVQKFSLSRILGRKGGSSSKVKNSVTTEAKGGQSSKVKSFLKTTFLGDAESIEVGTAIKDTSKALKRSTSLRNVRSMVSKRSDEDMFSAFKEKPNVRQRANNYATVRLKSDNQPRARPTVSFSAVSYKREQGEALGQGAFSSAYAATVTFQSHLETVSKQGVVLTGEGLEHESIFSNKEEALQNAKEAKALLSKIESKVGGAAPKIYLATAEPSSVQEGSFTTGIVQERLSPFKPDNFTYNTGGPPPQKNIDFCRGLISGLTNTHAAGLIHGDIKKDNIMVRQTDSGPEAVYIDWEDTYLDIDELMEKIDNAQSDADVVNVLKDLEKQYHDIDADHPGTARALGTYEYCDMDLQNKCLLQLEGGLRKRVTSRIQNEIGGKKWSKMKAGEKAEVAKNFAKQELKELSKDLQQHDKRTAGSAVYEAYFGKPYLVDRGGGFLDPNPDLRSDIQNAHEMPPDIKQFLTEAFGPI